MNEASILYATKWKARLTLRSQNCERHLENLASILTAHNNVYDFGRFLDLAILLVATLPQRTELRIDIHSMLISSVSLKIYEKIANSLAVTLRIELLSTTDFYINLIRMEQIQED